MVIRAVVFDIGVLEITPDLGVMRQWEARLGLPAGGRLDVRPPETVFLDDAELCVTGARDAGMHAIRYLDNAQGIAEIEKLLTGS